MRQSTMVRLLTGILAAVVMTSLAGCSNSGPADTAADTAAAPGASVTPTASGTPAHGENPCALLSAADVTSALGQTVSDTLRYETTSDDTATVRRCGLVTNGKPLSAAGFTSLSTLATGFTGSDLPSQPDATVGVVVVTRTTAFDANEGDTSKFPDGSKTLTGVGTFAVVLGSPTGGVGFAQTGPTEIVMVYDAEDRTVATSEVESLLRAAVSHR